MNPTTVTVTPEAANYLSQFIIAVAPVVFLVINGWIGVLVQRYVHNDAVAKAIDKTVSEAETKATLMVAADADNLAGRTFTVNSPEVVLAANKMMKNLPDILVKEGWDANTLAKLVAGKIGQFQAPPPPPGKAVS